MKKLILLGILPLLILLYPTPKVEADFNYTRTPSGNPVVSPISYHIQGVFGLDFCEGTYQGNYFTRYLITADKPVGGSTYSDFMFHGQGDIVDETVTLNLSPGTYSLVRLYCSNTQTGQGGPVSYVLDNELEIVPAEPTILTNSILSPVFVNQEYAATIDVAGGLVPYSFDITSGDLPNGLLLDSSTGIISGVPSLVGTFNFTIQVTAGDAKTDSKVFTLTIAPQSPGFIHTRTPSGNPVVSPISYHIQGVFGLDFCEGTYQGNYFTRYLITADKPVGGSTYSDFMFHGQGDIVDETVTLNLSPGTYSLVRLYCSNNQTGQSGPISYVLDNDLEVVVMIISTTSLPDATAGNYYSYNLNILGGIAPFAWEIKDGNLPSGLVLDTLTGGITGIPTGVETSDFTIKATDSNNSSVTKNLSMTVHGNTLVGQDINVGPIEGVTITFDEVTKAGQTDVVKSSSGTLPPIGFKTGDPATYYDISTTAEFTGKVKICANYDESEFKNENGLNFFHFVDGSWSNFTTSLNTADNVLCGEVTGLSEFGLFERVTIEHLIDYVQNLGLKEEIENSLLNKLNAAESALERGKTKTAVNILKAFINFVKAQRGKNIGETEADIFLTDVRALIGFPTDSSTTSFFKWGLSEWLKKLSTISD